jgi:hypothetical protein
MRTKAILMLIRLTAFCTLLSVVNALISCAVIWLYSPHENSNNPHMPEELARLRKISQVYVLVLAIAVGVAVICVPYGIPNWVSSSLAYGMIFFTGLLLAAKMASRRSTKAEL